MRGDGEFEHVRRYGPLVAVTLVLTLSWLLPSNLSQPDRTTRSQPEIAPEPFSKPPERPPIANFSTLDSLADGKDPGPGPGGGGYTPPPPPPPPALEKLLTGIGRVPASQYECIADRQTEDELSPTCVPFYAGDNEGATYQGVTAREVRVVLYYDAVPYLGTSQGTSTPPVNTIVDLDAPPKAREHPILTVNRSWQWYFHKRYAAYNRRVHLFVQFGSWNGKTEATPGQQASDAAFAYQKLRPFAVLNYSGFGQGGYYSEYMSQHGVLLFGAPPGHNNQFYDRYPGLQWGFNPNLEYSAAQYADAVCSIVQGKPADAMGGAVPGAAVKATSRTYGLLYTRDPEWAGVTAQALLARRLMAQQCGITVAIEQHYDRNGHSVDNSPDQQDYADNIAQQLKRAGVTTVLWPAGYEAKISHAMARIQYFPEIVVGDDDLQASLIGGRFQDPAAWRQAWVITSQTYEPEPDGRICTQAFRSVDTISPASDVQRFACETYADLRQLYTAIQAAGPHLNPQNITRGLHAIPRIASTNRQLPACFYLPNDYTCVKDSAIMHWDPTATVPTQAEPGCWRMVGSGQRFLPGHFPRKANLGDLKRPDDICNNFVSPASLQL